MKYLFFAIFILFGCTQNKPINSKYISSNVIDVGTKNILIDNVNAEIKTEKFLIIRYKMKNFRFFEINPPENSPFFEIKKFDLANELIQLDKEDKYQIVPYPQIGKTSCYCSVIKLNCGRFI